MVHYDGNSLVHIGGNSTLFMETRGEAHLELIWLILGEAMISLSYCAAVISKNGEDDENILLLMCSNALSDIVSAFLSIRQGFIRPPAVVLRGVVENLAAVVAFVSDEKEFNAFKQDRAHLPHAVTKSKEHFPELPKLYGMLTNSFTHETVKSVGRSIGTQKGLWVVPKLEGESIQTGQLTLLLVLGSIAHTMGQIVEWAFLKHLDNPLFWERT